MNGSINQFREFYFREQSRVPEMLSRLTLMYRAHDPGFRLDPSDQVYFSSVLYLLVRFFHPRRILQTGTLTGMSMAAMLLGADDAELETAVVTIDPEPELYGWVVRPVDLAKAVAEESGWADWVRFLKGYSGPAPQDEGDSPLPAGLVSEQQADFDMAVVDGDHAFRAALADLVGCADKLRTDGPRIVVVHDYNGIPQVRAAVDCWRLRLGNAHSALCTSTPSGVALIQLHHSTA